MLRYVSVSLQRLPGDGECAGRMATNVDARMFSSIFQSLSSRGSYLHHQKHSFGMRRIQLCIHRLREKEA
ncbi:hypothetical protein AN958_06950 [Leucoagaricus sp. SymC.cos]|nr:hypothetical protein AN958_06950 [Leucoagaricus sp. SymC.cos]